MPRCLQPHKFDVSFVSKHHSLSVQPVTKLKSSTSLTAEGCYTVNEKPNYNEEKEER